MRRIGGKLSFCSSYSGSSNSPIGLKFLIGISVMRISLREVTTIRSAPAFFAAAVILRIVVATPFTSSRVSVNQARLGLRKFSGTVAVIAWKISRNQLREGAGL